MSQWVNILSALLIILGYAVAPLMLIWGWVRWMERPKTRTAWLILSLIGFLFASASATVDHNFFGGNPPPKGKGHALLAVR